MYHCSIAPVDEQLAKTSKRMSLLMKPWRRRLVAAVVTFVTLTATTEHATACTSEPPLARTLEPWSQAQHPLVAHLWRRDATTADSSSCDAAAYRALLADLETTLTAGGVILLGEVHDNPEHHKLRGALLSHLATRLKQRPPALVFEHIRADQQSALDGVVEFDKSARRLATASDIFQAVDWSKSGWPDAQIFAPLYTAALRSKAALVAGDPARDKVKAVARQGMAALDTSEVTRLHLNTPLTPAAQDDLLTELEASHCGLMPKSAFGSMAVAQRYRDGHLAAQTSDAATEAGSAIIFAGNGHVRRDRGVPHYLGAMQPNRKVLAVALVEVEAGKIDLESYVLRDATGQPIYDAVIITPRATRDDPCDDMRKRFGKKG
jgi:uncharacterized iron-regulated protein